MALPTNSPTRPLDEILAETVHTPDSLEVHFVATSRVSCEGSGGALGHPKVYYQITEKGYAECMYCDRVFVLDPARAGEVLEGGILEGELVVTEPVKSLP